jgi:hypothetical protein
MKISRNDISVQENIQVIRHENFQKQHVHMSNLQLYYMDQIKSKVHMSKQTCSINNGLAYVAIGVPLGLHEVDDEFHYS